MSVDLLSSFKFGRNKNVYIVCKIDNQTVNHNLPPTIVKGKYPLRWEASFGVFRLGYFDVDYGIHFAFGRNMEITDVQRKMPEGFEDRGAISVDVVCGKQRTTFEFIYATRTILLQEGVLRAVPAHATVHVPSAQSTGGNAAMRSIGDNSATQSKTSDPATPKSHGNSNLQENDKNTPSGSTVKLSSDGTTRLSDGLEHATAVTTIGKKYDVDEVGDSPSKKHKICSEDGTASAKLPLAAQKEADADTPSIEERSTEFTKGTAKARGKARALAELKLMEMELKEQQIQVTLEKIQAKRELLELEADE